jgi:hypothetical protein
MGTGLQGVPVANFRARGRCESRHQGKGVNGALSRGSRPKSILFRPELGGTVLGDGAAQESGPFYIKL